MTASRDRILTTHVGSLPRSAVLTDLLIRQEAGEAVDPARLEAEIEAAVGHVVAQQRRAGIDIGNDGEQPRVGFQTYIAQRMSGFGGESRRPRPLDFSEFPDYARMMAQRFPRRGRVSNAPQAVAPVRYHGAAAVALETARLCRLAPAGDEGFVERFMTAPSPGVIATTLLNAHYPSHEAYLFALAREIAPEYRAIIAAGLTLQVDAPDLAMERTMLFQEKTDREFLAIGEMHVAALNAALDGIPRGRVRLHCCWGNWDGPHRHDIALAAVLPVLAGARVGGFSLEFANPRHQHEYTALKQAPLPPDAVLYAGVIDSTCNFVEHPEVVARRLLEAVDAVGDRERVVASTDCGFGSFAGYEFVAEDVVWAKLEAARAGADLATRRLWGR